MPLFVYTVVKIRQNKIEEDIGFMYGNNPIQIRTNLSAYGYLVRDVKLADHDDMKIARLRHFRNKIVGTDHIRVVAAVKKKKFWLFWFLVILLAMGVLAWLINRV